VAESPSESRTDRGHAALAVYRLKRRLDALEPDDRACVLDVLTAELGADVEPA
jgi:hypothetical protein